MSTFHAYVDAAHFHEALGNVLRFAAKRSRLPILEEAQVRFEDGHCVLTCTNLDQWCMSTIPAVGDSFSFVFVGTRKILSACKYFPENWSSLTRLNPQRQTLIRGAKFLSATGNGA